MCPRASGANLTRANAQTVAKPYKHEGQKPMESADFGILAICGAVFALVTSRTATEFWAMVVVLLTGCYVIGAI